MRDNTYNVGHGGSGIIVRSKKDVGQEYKLQPSLGHEYVTRYLRMIHLQLGSIKCTALGSIKTLD